MKKKYHIQVKVNFTKGRFVLTRTVFKAERVIKLS